MTFIKTTMLAFLSTTSKHSLTATRSSTRLFSAGPPTQYVLQYSYIPDVLEKRGPHRELHLNLAKDLAKEGNCLSGGPTTPMGAEVPDGAVFVFSNEESAKWFVEEDPYVKHGIVTDWSIKEWTVAIQA